MTGSFTEISDAAKQARREYKREWNKRNADKVRAAQRRYWEKRALMKREANDEHGKGSEVPDGRDPALSEH